MIINEKKRRRKGGRLTFTTGDVGYNIKAFNRAMGTDFEGSKPADVNGDGWTDFVNEAEMRRKYRKETKGAKRYYIRPDNIFCSTKEDILKILSSKGKNNNCSIYSLKRLDDKEDVSSLTPNDIVYRWDDGVLHDKNGVQVVDFDLHIKKELERPRLNVNTAPDSKVEDAYEDRVISEGIDPTSGIVNYSEEDFRYELDNTDHHITIGFTGDDARNGLGTLAYAYTAYRKDDDTYAIEKVEHGEDGKNTVVRERDYDTFSKLIAAIRKLDVSYPALSLKEDYVDDPFNLDFENLNESRDDDDDDSVICEFCGKVVPFDEAEEGNRDDECSHFYCKFCYRHYIEPYEE